MKLNELVKGVSTGGAGGLPEKRLARVARAVLQEVGAQIDKAPEGTPVRIPGLGTFRAKTVTKKSGESARRVVFRRGSGKAKARKAKA